MIFTALGLLVVAAIMLIAGIAKSSVLLLMLSLVFTLAAGAALAIAYSVARRSGVITEGAAPAVASPFATPPMPAADGAPTVPVVMYVPVDQLAGMSPGGMPMGMAGNGHGAGAGAMAGGASNGNGSARTATAMAPPVAGYDEMTAEQVGKLITSGVLNESQLQAVRDYEAANAARKSVLSRIDRRLYSQ